MAIKVHKVSSIPAPALTPAPETRGGGWRGWLIVVLISLLVATIVAICDRNGLLINQDLQGYDLLVKLQNHANPSENILFVDFDEATVREHNAFPLPRRLVADVLARISAGKPAVIGLDVLLDQPRDKDDDEHLADAIDKAGIVLLAGEYGFSDHPKSDPLPIFQDKASGVAFVDLLPDPDNSVRRMLLRVITKDYKRKSFPLALADLFSDRHLSPGRHGYIMFGKTEVPLATTAPDPDTVLIHFHPSLPTRRISVNDLLSNKVDASVFAGKIVVIGQTSEEGKDFFKSPVSNTLPETEKRTQLTGTEIHAAAADTLLNDEAIRELHGAPRWLLGLILGFLVAACGYRHRWFVSVGACLLLVAAVFGFAFYLFTSKHVWMPFISTEACLLLALPAGLGYRSVEERRLKRLMEAERGQIMGLFERYVSADVAAEIWKRRDQIVLAGEERVATILFSDIRSFTAMTCGVPSKEVLAWLNRYLSAMGEVIKANGGFLNKFIGDGIMVVFGAPLSEGPKDDACRAVQCALEMVARLDAWNASLPPGGTSLNDHPMKIGIGIHTGMVTAGNVGSRDRLEYSVIGEAVNLASRLESLTKEFHTPIVISSDTYELVQSRFSTVSLGNTPVRGMTNPIPLYSVEAGSVVEVHS